jgi:hypothetical protein
LVARATLKATRRNQCRSVARRRIDALERDRPPKKRARPAPLSVSACRTICWHAVSDRSATERVPSVLMGQIGRQSFEAGTRFES